MLCALAEHHDAALSRERLEQALYAWGGRSREQYHRGAYPPSAQEARQLGALFDAHIAEGAKILAALVRSESLEYPPGTGSSPIARIPGRDPTAAGGVEDRAFRDG